MPIEILGKTYLSEAEFAKELGCATIALSRLRKDGTIPYQQLPGRRGAFYGEKDIDECFAALRVTTRQTEQSALETSTTDEVVLSRDVARGCRSGVALSDIQRASAILNSANASSTK